MDNFLKQVARRIADEHPNDTDRTLVVFNNRRSLRFFQQQFAQLGRTMFLPRTMAIDDLIADLGGLEIVPNEFLLFELYRIHLELEGEEAKYKTFDEFISFGDLMLGDFSEIDQYCVPAKDLFVNLHDLKEVIEWDIESPDLTPFQRDYLRFYRSLYEYYSRLRERLMAEKKAYGGMAYRHVAENIGQMIEECPWAAVYFVGFNALSECERRIIGEYVRRGIGHLVTDGDPYFMQPEQEAGHFLRKHREEFPAIVPQGPSLFGQGKRSITIVECPENALQCKVAGQLLSDHPEWLNHGEESAVVLADEGLLVPCLNALPEGDYSVNISMGLAFCDTGMHLLASRVLSLWRNADKRGFYHSDILSLLSDHYVGQLLGQHDLRQRTTTFLRKGNIIRCKREEINEFLKSDRLSHLFCDEPLTVEGWIGAMRQTVAALMACKVLENNKKEKQAAGSLVEILDYLEQLQQTYGYIDNLGTLEKIYLRIAQRHQIALIGEPLSGLQLMGMLETRNIDFKHVILLSAGEGVLPAARSASTLVPFQLKQHFKLPTYREKDAVYAYNFYHLLLRAEEVYLVYSSASEAMGKGEPSRFLRQVEHELAPQFGIEVRHMVVNNNEPPHVAAPDSTGQKSEAIMQRLGELARSGFSPTVFDNFIECPLRYYYTRVLGISAEDNLEEDLDASQLGTAIHNILQHIYTPYIGRRADADGLRKALSELPTLMQQEFDSLFDHGRATEGRNHFMRNVAEAQISSLLRKEIALIDEGHNIEIVMLEQKLGPMQLEGDIYLKGTVDRVDRLDGRLRIIDYKTGSLDDNEITYRSTPNRSGEVAIPGKWFQLMCYALLYSTLEERHKTFSAGIYPLRQLQSGVRLASWDGDTDVTELMIAEFKEMLIVRCRQLMDPTIPFAPTAKRERCHYCDVRTFCPQRP